MTRLSSDKAAVVDDQYVLRPMSSCPLNAKVIAMNRGGVLCFARVSERDRDDWLYWFPLPVKPKEDA